MTEEELRKNFRTKQLTQQAMTLGKRESKTVEKDGVKYLMCGTSLVYEDDLCDKVHECFKCLCEIFGIELTEEQKCDDLEMYVSEVRDEVMDRFEKLVNGKVIFGSIEY